MVHHNVSVFNKDFYKDEVLAKRVLDRSYRFRLTSSDYERLLVSKDLLKREYGIKMTDLLRYFVRHCSDIDVIYSLGLLTNDPEILEIKLQL